jgi:RND family efflux transporter MFP subunit
VKQNVLIIVIVVVIVLVAAGFLGLRQMNASAASTTRIPTTTVQRGTLVATVDAAGNVSAPQQASMAFQTTGRVVKVNYQIGDKVKTGDIVMELDTSDLQMALKTAQASLASAQANYDSTQANLQFALRTAQANLDSAKANYDSTKAKNDTNRDQLVVAKAALDKATVALQQAQTAYDPVSWRPDVGMTSQAAALQSATDDYNSALATYRITAAGINDTALRTAQASIDTAQVGFEQAQKNLDTSMRTAQAQLDSAKVAVDQAQQNLAKAQVVAPFEGLVSAVNYDVGDTTGTSAAAGVADLSKLQVKVTVAEVDMAKLKVGDTAQMTLDALPGNTYTAKVVAIGPVGTVTQGVVNYPVTVSVSDNDPAIKPGMTANLAITVDQRQNVLLVPIRAVRTQGNQKIVTVLYKGQQIPVPVQLGLENDTSAEITSGLQEGDVILLTQTTTTGSNARGGGIPFIGGFGGR